MDVVKLTRELGAAIQKDERYITLQAAKKANDADAELTALIGKINLVQMSYQAESEKDSPDDAKLEAYDKEFREVYGELMLNKNMQDYENARHEIDELMNYLVQILSLCVNGEDPETCEPQPADHGCGGSCSSCSGCN
ncbi:MAG: YlbF family regulator [Oscillospiraceae bacterium]|jgi:cell fate (sporulation/competence/biofilm development) regulator YlbF (YheA/YmcA/DUF963 family)|nr:YlbF family regulator [Oscillospiraceae bacterium]